MADDLRRIPKPRYDGENGGHNPLLPTEINPTIISATRQPDHIDHAVVTEAAGQYPGHYLSSGLGGPSSLWRLLPTSISTGVLAVFAMGTVAALGVAAVVRRFRGHGRIQS
ncbi:MAG: hypothetical protein M3460_22560 [Actinomycetota bacterium]|nr:hypothetical protein [Actinomycetota bacterium]